jgi:hypothetical protein
MQAAVAVAYEPSACHACKTNETESLCTHTSRHPCIMCLVDMRAPRMTDRCPLTHATLFPKVINAEGRPPYIFTRCAVCNPINTNCCVSAGTSMRVLGCASLCILCMHSDEWNTTFHSHAVDSMKCNSQTGPSRLALLSPVPLCHAHQPS